MISTLCQTTNCQYKENQVFEDWDSPPSNISCLDDDNKDELEKEEAETMCIGHVFIFEKLWMIYGLCNVGRFKNLEGSIMFLRWKSTIGSKKIKSLTENYIKEVRGSIFSNAKK